MKKFSAVFLSVILIICCIKSVSAVENNIKIDKITFNNPGFIRGMDISSVISLENSGVNYYNFKGEKEDLLKILSDNGVNYIRVRIWNNPYDNNGNGYGGGNNDLQTAVKIAKRAEKYNLKMLLDFHYSDFWADPSKQKAPKEWENLSADQKAVKVKEFTLSALTEVKNTGAEIGMVQIGNETTSGIAGVTGESDTAKIMSVGSSAVREFDTNIKIALHFTNPENTDAIKYFADFLNNYNVDYDVFSTSYYPYWHGSLNNLTEVLNYAAEKYSKYVMVAETSYAYTLQDTDGHPNTVSRYSNNSGENLLWDFSTQGQAEEVSAVMNAVNNVKNQKGLGVFYWEGAWITVGNISNLEGGEYSAQLENNKKLWEKHGSGWASSFSGEYDTEAKTYYGGSAVDNQAFFNENGKALPSLRVFDYVKYGKEFLIGDSDLDDSVDILDAALIQKHLAYKTDINKKSADVNADGQVTIKDATLIQKYLAKIKIDFSIGEKTTLT